jgi:hypothetical protein
VTVEGKIKMDPFDPRFYQKNPDADAIPWSQGQWLHAHWRSKCDGDKIPARADFKIEDMPDLLPNMTIYDVEYDPLRFKARLIGSAVANYLGLDGQTGRYMDQWSGTNIVFVRSERMVETRQSYVATGAELAWSDKSDFLHYDAVGLPLADDGHTINKIMFLTQFY